MGEITRTCLAALGVAVTASAVVIAPAAYADDNDDAFLNSLKTAGIVPTSNDEAGRQAVVGLAHWVCDQLRQGAQRDHIIQWLMQSQGGSGDAQVALAHKAVLYYCPDQRSPFSW